MNDATTHVHDERPSITGAADKVIVRVSHRFDASAERVYDGFLDPERAGMFLFATPTGRIVRCEIDARVGGTFTIVDRRGEDDVVHTGRYVTLERPRLIVFTLIVEKYSNESGTVSIEIAPRRPGCDVTVTHEMPAAAAANRDRTADGWREILDVASELLVAEEPTCGIGIAQHAAIPARIAVMFEGLAETLALHRTMLVLDDPNARKEDEVYRELSASWTRIADLVKSAAAMMSAQRDLPMGAHDQSKWGDGHLRAFENFVTGQSQLLSRLRVAADRDERMLASMKAPKTPA
jgi:uncharacterized protein YndB with AHSA1/START domain